MSEEVEMARDNRALYDELCSLLETTRKNKPAAAAVAKLQTFLWAHPEMSTFAGNLATQAQHQIMQGAMPNDEGARISTETYIDLLRNRWGYAQAGGFERSLIAHVTLCWLRLHVTEMHYEQRQQASLTLAQGEYWERKLSAVQKRYLRAVETLARIRKLGINVQINIADKQIVNP